MRSIGSLRASPMGETVVVRFRLPKEVYERLRAFAQEHDTSIAEVVRESVSRFLTGTPDPCEDGEPNAQPQKQRKKQVLHKF